MLLGPFLAFVLLTRYGYLTSTGFVVFLLFFGLVYHPSVCAIRLVQKGMIEKRDAWKNYIPFWNFKFFNVLF